MTIQFLQKNKCQYKIYIHNNVFINFKKYFDVRFEENGKNRRSKKNCGKESTVQMPCPAPCNKENTCHRSEGVTKVGSFSKHPE